MKRESLKALLPHETARLLALSSEVRDDSRGGAPPGSERADEEERVFVRALSKADRRVYEATRGLGNSQKAEVAWLEEMEYEYEELDVRDFRVGD
jgi:hypothetical protein